MTPKPIIPHQLLQTPFSHFLILQRHGKSSWDDQSLDDFERPLLDKGGLDARRIGRYFADHTSMGGVWEQAGSPTLIVCSSSKRTRQTLSGWIDGFCEDKTRCQLNDQSVRYGEASVPVIYTEAIYEARNGSALLNYFAHMSSETKTLLLVGHSTALNELLEILTGGPPAVHFSTCGMALLGSQLSGQGWKRPGTFWLLDYVNPGLLTMD
jgi:phosphohistidine phosphatase